MPSERKVKKSLVLPAIPARLRVSDGEPKQNESNNMSILNKLNTNYPSHPATVLANSGDMEAAASAAAGHGQWGLWEQIRASVGLSIDDDARQEWMSAYKARRAAKFSK